MTSHYLISTNIGCYFLVGLSFLIEIYTEVTLGHNK